ncbi:MAG: DUF2249 domain-containing protein [Betaproteobacteria bacterium]|nr:DUF2249 domain-containing protein [Betaproteobacteria bacterium]
MTAFRAAEAVDPSQAPAWCSAVDLDRATQLDVRALLEAGHDPFGVIIEFARSVGPGGDLVLIAPFDPVPLRGVLAQDGFDSFAEQVAPRLWRAYFRRSITDAGGDGPAPRRWQEADGLHIDTGNADSETAREALAALLSVTPAGFDVVAHQAEAPEMREIDLARHGWRAPRAEGGPGAVRYRFTKRS